MEWNIKEFLRNFSKSTTRKTSFFSVVGLAFGHNAQNLPLATLAASKPVSNQLLSESATVSATWRCNANYSWSSRPLVYSQASTKFNVRKQMCFLCHFNKFPHCSLPATKHGAHLSKLQRYFLLICVSKNFFCLHLSRHNEPAFKYQHFSMWRRCTVVLAPLN